MPACNIREFCKSNLTHIAGSSNHSSWENYCFCIISLPLRTQQVISISRISRQKNQEWERNINPQFSEKIHLLTERESSTSDEYQQRKRERERMFSFPRMTASYSSFVRWIEKGLVKSLAFRRKSLPSLSFPVVKPLWSKASFYVVQ